MKLLSVALLAAFAFPAIAPAYAQSTEEIVVTGTKPGQAPGSETRSKRISYADLDLSKQAGVKALLARIQSAAKEVCSPEPMSTDMAGHKDYDGCISHAVDTAVAQVGNPNLSAMVASAAH
ncbi:MAG TPA: UrcA family protein [Alphaproteobacteria bacterium]|nr:UrcA family protein [Alphaproteobacteria bacterium]